MQSRNNISIVSHEDCTGCKACIASCPKSCISYKRYDLFEYPVINESFCINCGKCVKSCPAINISVPNDNEIPQSRYFYAWNKDRFLRESSTSGGVGSGLAQYAINNEYVVCGVTLSSNAEVKHIISEKPEVVDLIKGSKYVESNISTEVYHNILSYLLKGKKVFFFGTPCQVSALQNMVPRNCEDLLFTTEIICHGVNSRIVWKDFFLNLQAKYHSTIKSYNFRSKSKGWGKLRISALFENGKHFDVPAYKNQFHVWFGRHYILRPSCQRCKYRKVNRQADITIGDFWGVENILPEIDVREGVSVLISRTYKSFSLLNNITSLYMKEVDSITTSKVLKGYIEKRSEDNIQKELEQSKEFANLYQKHSFDEMEKLYPCPTFMKRIKASILFRIKKYFKR